MVRILEGHDAVLDSEKPDAYERVYLDLVERLGRAPLSAHAEALELEREDGHALVPLFDRRYRVGPTGVEAEDGRGASVSHRIVLAHYLLRGGRGRPAGRFVPYRELPGGMDFARNLAMTVEAQIAQAFSGRPDELRDAGRSIGARLVDLEVSCDVAFELDALPRIPMRLTFFDADEDFPAEAKVFYDLAATVFLDLECLAVLGSLLARELAKSPATTSSRQGAP